MTAVPTCAHAGSPTRSRSRREDVAVISNGFEEAGGSAASAEEEGVGGTIAEGPVSVLQPPVITANAITITIARGRDKKGRGIMAVLFVVSGSRVIRRGLPEQLGGQIVH